MLCWLLGFLCVVEIGLRLPVDAVARLNEVAPASRVHLVLGTSRVRDGVAAPELAELVVGPAWVANVVEEGRTTVGLAELYEEEVVPRLPGAALGTLAIEVRVSGMNDAFYRREEAAPGLRYAASVRDLNWEMVPAGLMAHSRLSSLRRSLDRRSASWPTWFGPSRGWAPRAKSDREDLDTAALERHYRPMLADFRVGGLQLRALRGLIARARMDGWTPVVFLMPVTATQRSFYPPNALELVIAETRRASAEEGAGWVDLETGHALADDAFRDTHHLTESGARRLAPCFAARVLAPEGRDPGRGTAACSEYYGD